MILFTALSNLPCGMEPKFLHERKTRTM